MYRNNITDVLCELLVGVTYCEESELTPGNKLSNFEMEVDEFQEFIKEVEREFDVELEMEKIKDLGIGELAAWIKQMM